jgi:hypothetical protein
LYSAQPIELEAVVSRTSLTRAQAVAIITMRGGAVW